MENLINLIHEEINNSVEENIATLLVQEESYRHQLESYSNILINLVLELEDGISSDEEEINLKPPKKLKRNKSENEETESSSDSDDSDAEQKKKKRKKRRTYLDQQKKKIKIESKKIKLFNKMLENLKETNDMMKADNKERNKLMREFIESMNMRTEAFNEAINVARNE